MSTDTDTADLELETVDVDSEVDAVIDAETSDDDDTSARRKATQDGQIRKAEQLLRDGKDLPESLKWTLKHIKTDEPKSPSILEIKAQLKDDDTYDKAKEELAGLGMNAAEMQAFKADYQKRKANQKIERPGEALAESLKLWKLEHQATKVRMDGTIPSNQSGNTESDASVENYNNLTKEDRIKVLRKMMGN